MNTKQFDKLAKVHFGGVLEPLGFSSELSLQCTFYKKLPSGLCQVIIPNLGTSGAWFNVLVFAIHPELETDFKERFPDQLGSPSETCYLSEHEGVGLRQQAFRCKKEEGFIRNFNNHVKPALNEHTVPFLQSIPNLESYLPYIHNKIYLARALNSMNKVEAARKLLLNEKRNH